MTNPVILLGTQSNGETLPVQVDATGRLVAEGLEGAPGEKGEKGDPFTYEDFTPEQLEALQGPPGADGPNDLKPYGPEWSYLVIRNGEPTWIADGSDPNPPGPAGPVVMVDRRGETHAGIIDYGAWSDDGFPLDPPGGWDEFMRTQATWENPAAQATGIGARTNENGAVSIPFSLEFFGGFSQILELEVASNFTCASNQVNSFTSESRRAIYPDNEHIQDVTSFFKNDLPTENHYFLDTFQFYITRDSLGVVDFTLNINPTYSDFCSPRGGWVQRWRLIDPAVYLMNLHMKKLKFAESLRNS